MDWEDRLRFNAAPPPADGLRRMARQLAGGAQVVELRRLVGGVDASTHALRFDSGTWVVLKRSWSTDAASLTEEFQRLEVAQAAPVPTPAPIAVDAGGDWFGRPALVMSLVPGRNVFHRQRGAWIGQLAAALAAIHAAPLPEVLPRVLHAPHAGISWRPPGPSKLRRTRRVEGLFAIASDLQSDIRLGGPRGVLLHHDFHHGNVLWLDDRLTGVLDWNEACIGPAASDVAYCSVDLTMTHGRRMADSFCAAYRAAVGTEPEDLARWQALWTVNAMRWIGYWVAGLHEAGADHLTLALLRRRLRGLADSLLARF